MSSVAKTLRRALTGDAPKAFKTQLPPRLRQLIGRQEQVNSVLNILRSTPDGHRLLIHGPPGVGKTVIALDVAHSAARGPRYDVVVWLDCQQTRLGRDEVIASATALRDLSDIVRELALAVNAEAILRELERDRIQILRSRLSEHRCLVIADAIDDILDQKIETYFFNLPDTVDIIATSRSNLRWREAECTNPLNREDTERLVIQELAVQKVKLEDGLLQRLVEISDGIPQTIGWLITLLSRGISLSEVEEELKKPDTTISRYYFRKQWEEVAKDQTLMRALVLVALAPSLKKMDASFALGRVLPQRTALLALNQIEDMHLIMCPIDHIAMLPTIRKFVLGAAEKQQGLIESVTIDWIENLITRVNAAQSRKTWPDVFSEIESFRLELLGALRAAAGPHDGTLQLRGAQLLYGSVYYLYSRGLWDALLETVEWAVPLQARHGNIESVMEVGLTWAVRAYRYRESIERAEQFLDEISTIISKSSARTKVPLSTYFRLAKSTLRPKDREDTQLAEELAKDAHQFNSSGNHEWACRAMLQAGNVWSESGGLEEARIAFEWVYEFASKLPPAPWTAEMMALSLGNRGIIANRLCQFDSAVRLLANSVNGLAQAYDQATAHGELGRAYLKLGKFKKAKQHAATCIQLSRSLNVKKSVVESEIGWELEIGKRLVEKSTWGLWLDRIFGSAE